MLEEAMARPKKPINEVQLRLLAERQWSSRQMGAFFGVHSTNIVRRYAALIEEAREHGKAKLIDVLWERAVDHKSDRVLIYLADRVLGPIPKKIELSKEDAIRVLEDEFKREGVQTAPVGEGPQTGYDFEDPF